MATGMALGSAPAHPAAAPPPDLPSKFTPAAYANPAIRSICKTDGLTYKVSEIITGIKTISAHA